MAKIAKKKREPISETVEDLIRELRERADSRTLCGKLTEDRNFPGRLLLIIDPANIVSIHRDDILDEGITNKGLAVVDVRASAQVWKTVLTTFSTNTVELLVPVEMEFSSPPPPPPPGPHDPKPATADDIVALADVIATAKSIAGAAVMFNDSCSGGDDTAYNNSCAHFLSDAFIRAGYTELTPPNACIEARCGTSAKRPIRARNMWCWFQKMAKQSRTTLPTKEGFWAVFQLKESEYWGGHVVIIDTDKGKFFGTGNYPNWDQYAYKW